MKEHQVSDLISLFPTIYWKDLTQINVLRSLFVAGSGGGGKGGRGATREFEKGEGVLKGP